MIFGVLFLILVGAVVFFTVSKWVLRGAGTVSGWLAKAAKWTLRVVVVIFVIYLIGVGIQATL